ncbi:alanine racemase [Streptococcus equi]|uniref:Alanine racemase n=1 Tax=Streptococcus equi subsp. equi (strain 4047) TaxID=553482 RepID=ALR_STRE4|nr:alanine racemase [Streptococcus equi]C0M6I5.1 RecName: Full=Alanine racemase [Streptococcus equi subsp. equi 4047]HEL1351753.1 alanine racemase [Streptococcus equi subsp. zooepidemicus]ASB96067.1 alanine racemase [Streptococcus equi subsp. equi]MBT1195311.1 alanine racemase [Streptococcus equi subsp. equi]MBT1198051.1 alanine racemase [Streptococcus equi subsp. equi]MBT1198408.1 alanine racemase [Streptococcus equi subsp. equi]
MISSLHRPTVARVDLEAIRANIDHIHQHIPKKVRTYAVVKANAYGHGAVAVSKAVEDQVDGYCVSNLDEALELRQAGIDKEILILGVILASELQLAIKHQLTITVASLEWLELAKKESVDFSQLHVHVKVDSGMGRIGVRSLAEANQLISILSDMGVQLDGIFTHFATADDSDHAMFDKQLTFFKQLVEQLDKRPALVHASNSATSLWHSETIFNAIRLGIVIYGLNPSGNSLSLPCPLKEALSLESRLVHVKQIQAGDSVGYGASYVAAEPEYVGTLPIGYADGWTRNMQGFKVLVEGEFCDIIGRVSMDQLTIRLPKAYPIGTKVTLIGQQGKQVITATDVADYRGTINYEVLCLLSDRIPREY